MEHLGVGENRVKVPIAWAAEKLGRLKPNGQLTGYSPLSRLVELEGLALGVTGKLALWRSLAATRSDLGSFGLETLIERAESQRDGLEKRRVEAAQARVRRARRGAGRLAALDSLEPDPAREEPELLAERRVCLARGSRLVVL